MQTCTNVQGLLKLANNSLLNTHFRYRHWKWLISNNIPYLRPGKGYREPFINERTRKWETDHSKILPWEGRKLIVFSFIFFNHYILGILEGASLVFLRETSISVRCDLNSAMVNIYNWTQENNEPEPSSENCQLNKTKLEKYTKTKHDIISGPNQEDQAFTSNESFVEIRGKWDKNFIYFSNILFYF